MTVSCFHFALMRPQHPQFFHCQRFCDFLAETDTFHSDGSKLLTSVFSLFRRKDGGFGGDPGPSEPQTFPDRPPDAEETTRSSPDQPLLYRLSGDMFQLHVDSDFARASAFERPIMHGLCTHGYACRAVIKHSFPGNRNG